MWRELFESLNNFKKLTNKIVHFYWLVRFNELLNGQLP